MSLLKKESIKTEENNFPTETNNYIQTETNSPTASSDSIPAAEPAVVTAAPSNNNNIIPPSGVSNPVPEPASTAVAASLARVTSISTPVNYIVHRDYNSNGRPRSVPEAEVPTPEICPNPQPPKVPTIYSTHNAKLVTSVAFSSYSSQGMIESLVKPPKGSAQMLLRKKGANAGDISDAVTKILEDYDWSQIPLANR